MARRSWLALVVFVAASAGVVVGAERVARWRLVSEARARGVALRVEALRPSARGLRLRGVELRVPEVPDLAVRLDVVEIRPSWGGPHAVLAHGGRVSLGGSLGDLVAELRGWRAARGAAPVAGGAGARFSWRFDGVDVDWPAPVAGGSWTAVGVGGHSTDAGLELEARSVGVGYGGHRLELRGASVDFQRSPDGPRLVGARAASLDATMAAGDGLSGRGDFRREVGGAADVGALVAALRHFVAAATAEEADVEVAGASAALRRGATALNVGPGKLTFSRRAGVARVAFTAGSGPAGATPVTGSLELPLEPLPVRLDLRGGPIALAALGIHERDAGLVDVARATLEVHARAVLSPDAQLVDFDGDARLRGLSFQDARLSGEAVRGVELAVRARGSARTDGSHVDLADGEVDWGAIGLTAHGTLDRPGEGEARVQGAFAVPLGSCDAMLGSLPSGLLGRVAGMSLAGTYALRGALTLDTRHLDEMRLELEPEHGCRVAGVPPELDVERLRGPFRHLVYGPDGAKVEIVAGPGSAGWVPFGAISPFAEAAVMTTEDGGFRRHRGFDTHAIESALREDVRVGRFVRGASTLSMQLAKNLWLDRDKTLARKLQEALLTMYLEQALTKDEILEYYLNLVELGPMVYGVGPAAERYFHESARDLSVSQALYLASILPNPKRHYFMPDGKLSPRWADYLRRLMRLMRERGRIDDAALQRGLAENVVLGQAQPDAPLPTIEPPAGGPEGWEPPPIEAP